MQDPATHAYTEEASPCAVTLTEGAQPQLSTIKSMYQIMNGKDRNWGLQLYDVSPKYEDPIQMRLERERSNPKTAGSKKQYITKKGHYLDDLVKLKNSPGPGTYPTSNDWVKKVSAGTKNVSPRKTYLDWIQLYEKKKKFPAPNAYRLPDTADEIKKKAKNSKLSKSSSEKTNFIDTCEYESLSTPGPGSYHPRPIMKKIKPTHLTQEEIRKREKQRLSHVIPKVSPDMNSYSPTDFGMFSRRALFPKCYPERKNGWGTQQRFHLDDISPKKNKPSNTEEQQGGDKENTGAKSAKKFEMPGPGTYNVVPNWNIKTSDPGKSNYLRYLSFGNTAGVYH